MGRNVIVKICDKIIESGIIFLIIFTPLAFGTVHVWAYTLMELTVIILLLVWLFKTAISYRLQVTPPLTLPLLLFLCLILFQMLPLPPSAIKHLSPNTYQLYQQTLPGWPNGHYARLKLPNPQSTIRNSQSQIENPALNSTNSINPKNSVNSTNSWRPLSIYRYATKTELLKIIAYIGLFFLIINNVKTRKQINRLTLAIILVGCFEAFYGLLEYLSGHQHIFFFKKKYYTDCVTGTYINRNHFAGYLEMVIPLTFGLLISHQWKVFNNPSKSWRYRLSTLDSWLSTNALLIFAAIIMILTLIFSQSRMGIFSLLGSMSFMSLVLLISSKRTRKRIIIFISTLALILILWGTWIGLNPVLERFSFIPQEYASESGRPVVWKDTINLIKDFPILGTGLGTYVHIFPRYKTVKAQVLYDHAHNDYLEFLSEVGIIGVSIVLVGIGLFTIKVIKRWRERRDPFVKGITLGGLTGIVAILLHSATDFNLHIPANALLLSIILGLTWVTVHFKGPASKYES